MAQRQSAYPCKYLRKYTLLRPAFHCHLELIYFQSTDKPFVALQSAGARPGAAGLVPLAAAPAPTPVAPRPVAQRRARAALRDGARRRAGARAVRQPDRRPPDAPTFRDRSGIPNPYKKAKKSK